MITAAGYLFLLHFAEGISNVQSAFRQLSPFMYVYSLQRTALSPR
jgi:hypothetical protein